MATHYYGTFFSKTTVDKIVKDLRKRGIIATVKRSKPVFAKDKFKYQVYTDKMV
jgi:predicted transcriptional regulator